MTEAPPELPPALAARFAPQRLLGSGAFGTVVLAEDRRLARLVAIKLMRTDVGGRDFKERFEREARLTASIQSAHLAKVHDHGGEAEHAWIVYEYVEGETLRERLEREGPLGVPAAGRILTDMLAGLGAIHARGVVHRDVKPANTMLTATGSAVLIDLGLGRGRLDTTLTASGAPVGSPAYMTPEQMSGEEASPTWDLYAASLSYVQMLTGQVPMLAKTLPETFFRRAGEGFPGLASMGVRVPARVDALLARTLSPQPMQRPPSAEEFLEDFEAAWRVQPLRPSRAAAAPARRDPPGPAARLGWPLAVLALGVGLGGVVGVLRPGGARSGEGGPPAVSPSRAPEGQPGLDWEAALKAAAADLERDPEIVRATSLTVQASPEAAAATWHQGRAAFRRHLREGRVASWVEAALAAPATPGAVAAGSRLYRIQALLSLTTLPDVDPLFTPAEDPHLDRLAARAARWRPEPALSGRPSGNWRTRQTQVRALLERGGRRWWPVRRYEELIDPERPDLGPISAVAISNLAGVPFVFPIPAQGEFVVDEVYPQDERDRDRRAPRQCLHSLGESNGDLVLALQLHAWTATALLWVELEGQETSLPLVFVPPPLPGDDARIGGSGWQGYLVEVPASLVPPGLRSLRVEVNGLQPVATPKYAVNLEEIYQLVAGEVPGVLKPLHRAVRLVRPRNLPPPKP